MTRVTAEDAKGPSVTEWTLGETISGEAVDLKSVKGKVVVLEYWGVRCPPCIASLPDLAKLYKRHRDEGLIVIGAESQGHSKNQVEPVIKKAKVEYTITKGAKGPVRVSGIPHILVFDRSGAMIFDGRPFDREFERAVKKALKEDSQERDSTDLKSSKLFEMQEWTNQDGQTMSASVKEADETTVTFIMPRGNSMKFPMEKLSEESRNKILEAIKD